MESTLLSRRDSVLLSRRDSVLLSRRDVDFLLFEWLAVDDLTKRKRYSEHSRETFAGLLDLCEDIATRYFAPHNKKNDAHEPTFDGQRVTINPEVKVALDAFAKADLLAVSMDHELGGGQLPSAVAGAGLAWFHAANVGTAAYVLLSIANASSLGRWNALRPMIDPLPPPPRMESVSS
jgi:butyryl-CoA dehydrogenase